MEKIKILKERVFLTFHKILLRFEIYPGTASGYLTGNFFAGPSTGQSGRISSFILNIKDWQIYFHHWLACLLILVVLNLFLAKKFRIPTTFLFFSSSFLTGLVFQGIHDYSDWYRILIKRN